MKRMPFGHWHSCLPIRDMPCMVSFLWKGLLYFPASFHLFFIINIFRLSSSYIRSESFTLGFKLTHLKQRKVYLVLRRWLDRSCQHSSPLAMLVSACGSCGPTMYGELCGPYPWSRNLVLVSCLFLILSCFSQYTEGFLDPSRWLVDM